MSAARGSAWDGGPPGAEIDYTPRPSVDGNNVAPLLPSHSQWPPPLTVPPPLSYPVFSNIQPAAPNPLPFLIDNSQVRQASDFCPGQHQYNFHRLNQVRDDKDDKFSSNKSRRYQEDRKYQKDDNCTRRRSRSRDSKRSQKDLSNFQTHPKASRRSRSRSTSRDKKVNRFKKASSSSSDRSSASPHDRRRRSPSSSNDRRHRSRSSSDSLSILRRSRRSPDRTSRITQNFRADKNISKSDELSAGQRYTDKKSTNPRHQSPNRSRSRDRNPYQQRQAFGRHPRSRSRSTDRFNKQYDSKEHTVKFNQKSKKNSEKRSSSRESNPLLKDSRTNVRPRYPAYNSERNKVQTSRRSESHYRGSKLRGKNTSAEDSKTQIPPAAASFKNDGSFLEMFKKLQESQTSQESTSSTIAPEATEPKKAVLPFIGKRRGGRVLKTGMVKKTKTIEEHRVDDGPKDAWSLYLQEVKKYRETSCEEEGKTRPLVK